MLVLWVGSYYGSSTFCCYNLFYIYFSRKGGDLKSICRKLRRVCSIKKERFRTMKVLSLLGAVDASSAADTTNANSAADGTDTNSAADTIDVGKPQETPPSSY